MTIGLAHEPMNYDENEERNHLVHSVGIKTAFLLGYLHSAYPL